MIQVVRRLVISAVLLLALAGNSWATVAHITGCDLTQGAFQNGGTTSTFNATGATEIVVGLVIADGSSATLSSSPANTWVALTDPSPAKQAHVRLWHVTAPSVSSSMTVTVTGTSITAAVAVLCFSGTVSSAAVDVQSMGSDDNVTSIALPSVTPTSNGQVVVAVLGYPTGDTPTINGGFSAPLVTPLLGGNNYGIAMAYLIQTTAAASAPTWSWTTTGSPTTAQASFIAASTSTSKHRGLMGVGK